MRLLMIKGRPWFEMVEWNVVAWAGLSLVWRSVAGRCGMQMRDSLEMSSERKFGPHRASDTCLRRHHAIAPEGRQAGRWARTDDVTEADGQILSHLPQQQRERHQGQEALHPPSAL